MDRWIDAQMHRRIDGQIERQMRQMRWMDGWIDRQKDGQVGRQVDRQKCKYLDQKDEVYDIDGIDRKIDEIDEIERQMRQID